MLDTTRNRGSRTQRLSLALALLLAAAPLATAQLTAIAPPNTSADLEHARLQLPDSELPDSPGALVSSSLTPESVPTLSPENAISSSNPIGADSDLDSDQATSPSPGQPATAQSGTPKRAFHLAMVVHPGEIADPMTVQDKVVGGLKDSISLFSALGWIISAGYDQLANSSPNYGTDSTAFGKRFGAAVARDTSETIFSESLFAPLFHEDPRYYVLGPGHNGFKRLVYAGTRCIIGRTDSGHTTPNFALIAGNAAGAALTVTYYPGINTTASEVASTFGTSLGGSALAYVVDEFIVDALIDLHLKRKEQQP
jgi:hypothetical protein